ncbi:MAG: J domain-containing protein [Phenylobacterium sp.]
MLYLALGAAGLAFFIWVSGGKPILKRREWRFTSAAFALAAFTGAAFVGLRGAWWEAIVLVVLGLSLAASARRTPGPTASGGRPPRSGRMGVNEARSILGVAEDATAEEIQAAYTRLMRLAHPDKGGTSGLAAQLNAARDRLLSK